MKFNRDAKISILRLQQISIYCLFLNTFTFNRVEYPLIGPYLTTLFALVFFVRRSPGKMLIIASLMLLPSTLYSLYNGLIPAYEVFKYLAYLLIPFSLITDIRLIYFSRFMKSASIVTVLIALVLYFLNISVDYAYGIGRIVGLLSEPSALALPISLILIFALIEKSPFLSILSIASIILSQSPTVFIVCMSSLILYFFIELDSVRLKSIFLAITSVSFLITLQIFLASSTFGPLRRLQLGIIAITEGEGSGYNPRLMIFNDAIEFLSRDFNFFFGTTINTSAYLESIGEMSGIPFFMIVFYSFGGIVFLAFMFSIVSYIMVSREHRALNAIFSSSLAFSIVNAAQGIFLTVPLLTVLVWWTQKQLSTLK